MRLRQLSSLYFLLLLLALPLCSHAAIPSDQVYGPVAPKEILSLIAQKVRGEHRIPLKYMMQALQELNPDSFSASGNLLIGSTLIVPDMGALSEEVPELLRSTPTPPATTKFFAPAPKNAAPIPNEPVEAEPAIAESIAAEPEAIPTKQEVLPTGNNMLELTSELDLMSAENQRQAEVIQNLTDKISDQQERSGVMQNELDELRQLRAINSAQMQALNEEVRLLKTQPQQVTTTQPISLSSVPAQPASKNTLELLLSSTEGQVYLGLALLVILSIMFMFSRRTPAQKYTNTQNDVPTTPQTPTDFGFTPVAQDELEWTESHEDSSTGEPRVSTSDTKPEDEIEDYAAQQELGEESKGSEVTQDSSEEESPVDIDSTSIPEIDSDSDDDTTIEALAHSSTGAPVDTPLEYTGSEDVTTLTDPELAGDADTLEETGLRIQSNGDSGPGDASPQYTGSEDVTVLTAPKLTGGVDTKESGTLSNQSNDNSQSEDASPDYSGNEDITVMNPPASNAGSGAGHALQPELDDTETVQQTNIPAAAETKDDHDEASIDSETLALTPEETIIEDKISFAYLHVDMGDLKLAKDTIDEINLETYPRFTAEINNIRTLLEQSSSPNDAKATQTDAKRSQDEARRESALKQLLKLATGYVNQGKIEHSRMYIAKILKNGTAEYKKQALVLLEQTERIKNAAEPAAATSSKIDFESPDNLKTVIIKQHEIASIMQRDKHLENTQSLQYHEVIPVDLSSRFESYRDDEVGSKLALAYLFLDLKKLDQAKPLLQDVLNSDNPELAEEAKWLLKKLQPELP